MTLLNQPSLTESREKKKTFRLGDEKVEEGIVCQHFFEKYKFNIKEFFCGTIRTLQSIHYLGTILKFYATMKNYLLAPSRNLCLILFLRTLWHYWDV